MQTAVTKLISKSPNNVMELSDAKDHLRILPGDTDQDTLVRACMNSAIQWAETRTERIFSDSVYQLRIVPEDMVLVLPITDFKEITKIETKAGSTLTTVFEKDQTGTLSNYVEVDDFLNPAELTISTANISSDVDYLIITASFGMTLIPDDISAAIKLLLTHFYENTNEVSVGRTANQIPMGAETILAMNTFKRFG